MSVAQKPVALEEVRQDAEFICVTGLELLKFLIAKKLLPPLPPRDRVRFDKRDAIRKQKAK